MSLIIDNLNVETILTASTIYSGATELGQTLSSVFVSQAQYTANTVQGVEQGSNIITGNTSNYPSISVVASPSFAGLTTSAATTINSSLTVTGTSNFTGALQSGGTNLYSIFTTLGTQVTFIQPGSNIATGGTVTSPIISVVASPSFAGLTTSAATTINSSLTVTGTSNFTGALQSGGTNLYSIFTQPGAVVSNVSAGSNIVTGGTATNPTISVVASPSFAGLTTSGATTHNGSLTVTGTSNFTGQIQSGGTNIDTTFLHQAGWLNNKAGTVSGSTFAGNPKTAAITFTTPFTGNYAVSIMADVSRTWNVQSVTLSGFTINSNANTAFASNNVYWTAIQIGEGTK